MNTPAQPFQVDPTENVKDLTEANSKRLDDLRDAQNRLFEAQVSHLKETAQIRADHDREIRVLETARLDAIRRVDVGNQTVAAERQQAAILTVERTNNATSETLRAMVDTKANTLAAQTATTMLGVEQRLAALERVQYEGQGKASQADPMIARLAEAVESLTSSRAASAGARGGVVAGREWIGWVVGLIIAALSIAAYVAK